MFSWDPGPYLEYADERGRPFLELLGRVGATDPRTVADLGCGAGNLTALLPQRWPDAHVLGVDASSEMVAAAPRGVGVELSVGEIASWQPAEPVDVLLSGAALQWVPGHLELLPHLLERVRPGGWFAFQVPGNFDQPSHTIRRGLAAETPYAAFTGGVAEPSAHDAATYLRALRALGCEVDAWETTYVHVLTGPDPVLRWIEGTSLRPTLAALPTEHRQPFVAELARRLAAAYPTEDDVVLMPFRRVFVVARR